MTGADLSMGIIKDVLISTTLEVGEGFHNYLYGLAVDLVSDIGSWALANNIGEPHYEDRQHSG
jgi:nucleoside-specific outer membrane channel protein Tsx